MYSTSEGVALGLLFFILVLTIGVGIRQVIVSANSPTINLIKDSWKCTQTDTFTTIIPIQTGNNMPVTYAPVTTTECTQYTHK